MVNIVVMEKTEIRTPCPLGRVGDGQTTSLEDGHLQTVKKKKAQYPRIENRREIQGARERGSERV